MAVYTRTTLANVYADYWKRSRAMDVFGHEEVKQSAAKTLLDDLLALITAYNTDQNLSVAIAEPRYTITPFSLTNRPYKVRAGQALNYTFANTGGETTSAAVWSGASLPSWVTFNSGTGALTGTAPAITSTNFNVLTGGGDLALVDNYRTGFISCANAFGESVNGPLPFTIQVVHASTPVVSSAGTGGGVHAGALTTYNVVASGTPTSYKAYDLSQLNAGTGGTVAINPTTGAITGNCGSATTAGTYTIYVCAVNAYGEGEDKAVVITLT
jgi:hypothetical protein